MKPKLSYCVVSKDRLYHAKMVMEHNFLKLRNLGVELLLLDYASSDGLEEWVLKLADEIGVQDFFSFYQYRHAKVFNSSHSKNMAHRLAQADIVCNLDVDRFVVEGLTEMLVHDVQPANYYAALSHKHVHGLVACKKSDWKRVGGYDETFDHYGTDDVDFVNRLNMAGVERVTIPSLYDVRLCHSAEERVAGFGHKETVAEAVALTQQKADSKTEFEANKGKMVGDGAIRVIRVCSNT